ncbi:hypothetical protein IEQ34_021249 [Dendrobium chrysotoxum]|uniref:Uncharacterized protein n=1 Tax=Dendrobium chrysotoxum TaxID=161865 RepID=A0AAV7G510_DENCH|nr:hypothetical protein IEQ34_021249 [Dendrobium chrysotoxum]
MKVPARTDRACFPPPGYVTVVPFSDGRLFSDAQGRISFKSKWLDIHTRDPSKGWINNFFYVQNDWGLQEKWGKLKELPVPLHIGAEDLLRILKLPDLDALYYETGAEIEGLTPSQASGDASSDSGGEELESELQRAFALEKDEDDVEIL